MTDTPGIVVLRQYVLGDPVGWDSDCEAQMRGQSSLWNKLVEIERDHRRKFFDLTADDPIVAAAEAEAAQAFEEWAALKKERAARRSAGRSKRAGNDDDAIRGAKEKLDRKSGEAKSARRRAREKLKPALQALENARYTAVKTAYQTSGLWWGNYNAVVASYNHARNAAIKQGGELHFHRFIGEGRIVNQIQMNNERIDKTGKTIKSRPALTVEGLYAGIHAQVKLIAGNGHLKDTCPEFERKADGRRASRVDYGRVLEATVFSRGRVRKNCQWPIAINRPLPAGAAVKEVAIHRRLVANHVRWTATFTLRLQTDIPLANAGLAVAVNLGWRRLNDGLRVATIVDEAGGRDFVRLPEKFLAINEWLDSQKSYRDTLHSRICDVLRDLPWADAPAPLQSIVQWWCKIPVLRRVPRHTVRIASAWREHAAAWRPDDFAILDQWRRHDKRIWQRIDHRSNRLGRERLDIYRHEAKKLISNAGVIILNKFDIGRMARQKNDSLPNETESLIKRHRMIAAPSVLRQWIVNEAAKAGVAVRYHADRATFCSVCDRHAVEPMSIMQHCTCGRTFDQDVEACENMLAANDASGDMAAE